MTIVFVAIALFIVLLLISAIVALALHFGNEVDEQPVDDMLDNHW